MLLDWVVKLDIQEIVNKWLVWNSESNVFHLMYFKEVNKKGLGLHVDILQLNFLLEWNMEVYIPTKFMKENWQNALLANDFFQIGKVYYWGTQQEEYLLLAQ